MAPRPPRKGFAYEHASGKHAGFVDAIGHTPRAGANTYAAVVFDWGAQQKGTGRARTLRYFMQLGDEAGDYRLSMEIAWCYNYPELEKLFGAAVLPLVIPAADLAAMIADPRIYVETPEAITFDFEAWHSDATVYRVDQTIPVEDSYAFKLIGYLDYTMTKHQHAPRPTGSPTGYRRLNDTESLTDCAHPRVRPLITACPDVSPVDADDHACHLTAEVPQSGGPILPYIDEELAVGANDHFIKVIEHGSGGNEVYSYVDGSVLADPLSCVEVFTVEQLAAEPTLSPEAQVLLAKRREQRPYLWGSREFVPGWRQRTVRRRAVRRQLIIAKPVTVDSLSASMAAEHLGTFECALRPNGRLQAMARLSESANLYVVRRLLTPSQALNSDQKKHTG